MKNLLGMHKSRDLETKARKRQRGMSGQQIALFVGGGFVVCIVILYLINNWNFIANEFLCWAQNVAGMDSHFHIPDKDGKITFACHAKAKP